MDDRPSGPGPDRGERAALRVALGIFSSRVAGLVRQRVFAHYFGLTAPADAFTAASRIPNFLNNLFGEGALSGSFIPVYASLLARGDRQLADRVAGAIAALLALVVAVIVVAGIAVTPWILPLIAPGFAGPTRELAIRLVRILFPAVGLTVMSAWCLGVLNSHRRFFLSYAVAVIWNGAMIATMLLFGEGSELPLLAERLAWGSVVGSALMVATQLPVVFRVAPNLSFALDTRSDQVRTIARNFVPVFMSRGVVQLSGYIDTLLATLVSTGATTALANAQTLYLLPISLFGMSVSAAELPAMAGLAHADEDGIETLRHRLDAGLRQIAFFIVPSAAAFLALGDVIAAALFQTGRFGHDDAVYVWGILAGSAVGLLASTLGRLYFFGVLRAARYAAAAQLRHHPRRPDDRPRLCVRHSAAAMARCRASVGRRRTDGVGRHRRLGGNAAAAAVAQRADRPDWFVGRLLRYALGVGNGGGGGRVGRQTDVLPAASDPGGDSHPRTVRHRVSVRDGRARRSGSEKRPRVAEPRSAKALAERRRLP